MRDIFTFLSLLCLLASCSTTKESSFTKHEYSEIYNLQISYKDVLKQSEDEYYIYYYQTSCYHCHGIKSNVIDYALHSDTPFYFIEIKEDYGFLSHSKEETIGTSDPLYAFSMMTPQLSLVKKWKISETYIGMDEIMNIIE